MPTGSGYSRFFKMIVIIIIIYLRRAIRCLEFPSLYSFFFFFPLALARSEE